jgi:hypothetical protein
MHRDLETAKESLKYHVQLRSVLNGGEPSYHIIQANKTPNFKHLEDDNYIIVSDTYAKQLELPQSDYLATEIVGDEG